MKSIAVLLASSLFLMGASCEQRQDPPVAVTVKVAVPVPCNIQDPPSPAWAYDSATKAMPLDEQLQRLRAEAIQRDAYIGEWRAALAGCRATTPNALPSVPPSRGGSGSGGSAGGGLKIPP